MTGIVWPHVQENWIYMGRWQNTNHSSPPHSCSNAISSFLLSTVNYKLAVISKAYAVIDTCVMQHLAIVCASCIRVMCSQGDVFGSSKLCFLVSLLLPNLFLVWGTRTNCGNESGKEKCKSQQKTLRFRSSLMNLSGMNHNQPVISEISKTRMHSCRKHTARFSGRLWMVVPRGVSSTHATCEQNDWKTGVKTLPSRNFVCGR